MAKLTGKSGTFLYGGNNIPFTKWTPKTTRTLADTTDSANYSSSTDILNPSQIPVMVGMELSIEGFFDTTITEVDIMAVLFTGAAALPVVLNLAPGVIFGHGNFDLSDFTTDVPVNDAVKFTATLKQNGVFTPGS